MKTLVVYDNVHLNLTQDVEEDKWVEVSGLATLFIACEVSIIFIRKVYLNIQQFN